MEKDTQSPQDLGEIYFPSLRALKVVFFTVSDQKMLTSHQDAVCPGAPVFFIGPSGLYCNANSITDNCYYQYYNH